MEAVEDIADTEDYPVAMEITNEDHPSQEGTRTGVFKNQTCVLIVFILKF
jgi:hypothetical protein